MSCVNNAHHDPVPPTECFERKELLCTRKHRRSFQQISQISTDEESNVGHSSINADYKILPSDVTFPIDTLNDDASIESLETSLRNSDGHHGTVYLEITSSPIQTELLTNLYAASAACGAIATFLGVTRDHFQGKKVEKLSYEAYTRMALKQMRKIAANIYAQFPQVHRVVFSHRIGVVPVKEASVFLAVSTEHRQSGLQAVSYAIDTLKATVPIWKREYYEEEGSEPSWKRNPEALGIS